MKKSGNTIYLLLLSLLLLVPLRIFALSSGEAAAQFSLADVRTGRYSLNLEKSFRQFFPLREELSNMAWNMRYRIGTKEIDGYFITKDAIIKNVAHPISSLVEQNNDAILQFAQRTKLPTYFMLLPTSVAICQEQLPDFSDAAIFNQKNFLEEVYQSFGGGLITVDAYTTLLANQEKNLYYNTEDALTPLGGYYIYSVLGARLGASPVNSLNVYGVEYAQHNYFGSLSKKFPYATLKPDILALYHFRNGNGFTRSYQVTHEGADGVFSIMDLYDRSKLQSKTPMDVYFGGIFQVMDLDIRSGSSDAKPSKTKLLIVGDDTARSYVPFLAPHYGEIRILNAAMATEEQFAQTDIYYYDQVLFAFSADTYMHNENLYLLGEL